MSKVTIDQFRAQVKPTRGSKLDPFCDEILALYDEGYSLDQIMEFLELNDVQVAKSTLHGFIKRRVGAVTINKTSSKKNTDKKKTGFKGFNPPTWADPATQIDDLI